MLYKNELEKEFNENTRDSKLTVDAISSINTKRSQFAFLFACYTAKNISSVLIDKGIHLAGGFQLAGYSYIIASLWEANNALCVAVAKKFYNIVFAESKIVKHDKIAYALYDTIFATRRSYKNPLSWATIIYFGP